jgi:uncharacterized membrane protein
MENYSPTTKSAIGLDSNVAAALGYIIGILGLINFIIDKENRFVRFHGIQSVLYSVGISAVFTVVWVVLVVLGLILGQISGVLASLVGILGILVFLVFLLALFGGLIYGAFKSYQGEMFKFPVVGNFAEKIAK